MDTSVIRGKSLFFTLCQEKRGGCSIPYSGDLLSFFFDDQVPRLLSRPADFLSCILEEDRCRIRKSLTNALKSKSSFQGCFELSSRGENLIVELILSPRAGDRFSLSWDGFLRELPGQKEENKTEERESLFRRYVESAPDGIFLADSNGLFIDANPAACRITGYSRSELLGMPLSSLTYHEDRELTKESFLRVKTEGRTSNMCRFIKKDGTVRHWVVEAVSLEDGTFLGFNRDITEQRKLEDQLIQMEKMDAIGQLAGGVAHDFNNQIAVIMGYSEMLMNQLSDRKCLKFAKNILAAAHRSDDLTRKLLAFSRKELSVRKNINMNRIVGEVADILTHSFDRKISIRLDLKAKRPFVSGDPSQIQNVLMNLALNARDAMPNGGTLILSTRNIPLDEAFCRRISYRVDPGEFVELVVSDTGVGMDSHTVSHIFEPFYTTKDARKGTGMGLASVYGTVTNHKAVIDVESSPGEGTSFRLFFPCGEKSIDDAPAKLITQSVRGSATVMLVDDEEMIRGIGRDILEDLGYRVVSFERGPEALDYLKSEGGIDLVILDMIMPEMSGKEVFRSIKEIDNSIPVILSSGFSLTGEMRRLIDEGAKAYINKPYKLELFASIVSKALESV